jgi:hypothetical protein
MKSTFRIPNDALSELLGATSVRSLIDDFDIAKCLGLDLSSIAKDAGYCNSDVMKEQQIFDMVSNVSASEDMARTALASSYAYSAADEHRESMSSIVNQSVSAAASATKLMEFSAAPNGASAAALGDLVNPLTAILEDQREKLRHYVANGFLSSTASEVIKAVNAYSLAHRSAFEALPSGTFGMAAALDAANAARDMLNRTAVSLTNNSTFSAYGESLIRDFERLARQDVQAYEVLDAARYAADAFAAYEKLNIDSFDFEVAEPSPPTSQRARELGRAFFVFMQLAVLGEIFSGDEESPTVRSRRIAHLLRFILEIWTGTSAATQLHEIYFAEERPETSAIQAPTPRASCENLRVTMVRSNARLRESPGGAVIRTLKGGTLVSAQNGEEVKIGNTVWILVQVGASDDGPAAHGWIARRLTTSQNFSVGSCPPEPPRTQRRDAEASAVN